MAFRATRTLKELLMRKLKRMFVKKDLFHTIEIYFQQKSILQRLRLAPGYINKRVETLNDRCQNTKIIEQI